MCGSGWFGTGFKSFVIGTSGLETRAAGSGWFRTGRWGPPPSWTTSCADSTPSRSGSSTTATNRSTQTLTVQFCPEILKVFPSLPNAEIIKKYILKISIRFSRKKKRNSNLILKIFHNYNVYCGFKMYIVIEDVSAVQTNILSLSYYDTKYIKEK